MRIRRATFAILLLLGVAAAAAGPDTGAARIEARSADLFVVGTAQGAHMRIHLSRISDNAPVRDAVVNVVLRGTTHAATADADGSYSIDTPDLDLPGAAAVQFQVTLEGKREDLGGTLDLAKGPGEPQANNNSRQLGWWLLNFAVCIGFLVLWRRRKGRPNAGA